MKWSILCLNWNRNDSLQEMFKKNIDPFLLSGRQIEILICDQGTKDINSLRSFLKKYKNVTYSRINGRNEGTPRSLNQLFIRARGDYIAIMANDIILPDSWWESVEDISNRVTKCGLIGFECTKPLPPLYTGPSGVKCHPVRKGEAVFGDWFCKREVIEEVGAFCEMYHPYGLWDSDYNFRVSLAGFQSVYIYGKKSIHVCDDVGEDNDYRKMKNFALENNSFNHIRRSRNYQKFGYWIPFPGKI